MGVTEQTPASTQPAAGGSALPTADLARPPAVARADRAVNIATLARAVGAFVATFAGLAGLGYFPLAVTVILAGAAGIVMLVSTTGSIAVYLVVLALPLLWANPVYAVVVLILGFATLRLLAEQHGGWFFLLALAPVAAKLHALWAVPLLAGFYLGSTEGFVVGLAACLALELVHVLTGIRIPGMALPAGGVPLTVTFRPPGVAPGLANLGWLVPRVLDMAVLQGTARQLAAAFSKNPVLIIQPGLWGAAGAIGGLTLKRDLKRIAPILVGIDVLLVAGTAALASVRALGAAPPPLSEYAIVAGISLAVALPWTAAALALARAQRAPLPFAEIAPMQTAGPAAAATESAIGVSPQSQEDVVELLRTIATAQDVIKERFTQNATMLLTDMKEFSKMTHEQGSVPAAETVQRYRDLLSPVIESHNGKGSPTGGDGIVAAFASPDDAIDAAADMQQSLARYNEANPSANKILIRIGLDTGEVVFDRDSNPFIGDALNLASRIMNLADAGQIFVSRRTIDAATRNDSRSWHDHGSFTLRGITEDVAIHEILWQWGQVPRPPDPARQ